MGPPAFAGGNLHGCPVLPARPTTLQWGHRLSPVETRILQYTPGPAPQASMGPPAFAGGNRQPLGVPNLAVLASMGPPAFAGGNSQTPRIPVDTEGASMGPPAFAGGNIPPRSVPPTQSERFNGATGFRRWKPVPAPDAGGLAERASMGPPAFAGGNPESAANSGYAPRASMGPPAFAGGNVIRTYLAADQSRRFNGATGFRRWKPGASGTCRSRACRLQWGHRLSPVETH